MAPAIQPFPLSELHEKVQYRPVNFRPKRRKVRDFDLETCELFELVQYSCTSQSKQAEQTLANDGRPAKMECFPFVRLFRRCGKGEKMFHVETTAWEGENAYEAPAGSSLSSLGVSEPVAEKPPHSAFAVYGNYFWSK